MDGALAWIFYYYAASLGGRIDAAERAQYSRRGDRFWLRPRDFPDLVTRSRPRSSGRRSNTSRHSPGTRASHRRERHPTARRDYPRRRPLQIWCVWVHRAAHTHMTSCVRGTDRYCFLSWPKDSSNRRRNHRAAGRRHCRVDVTSRAPQASTRTHVQPRLGTRHLR